MNAVNLKLVRGIFGALVVGAIGFGATQALASPTQAAFSTCSEEGQQACNDICRRTWGGPGYCMFEGAGSGPVEKRVSCECSIFVD